MSMSQATRLLLIIWYKNMRKFWLSILAAIIVGITITAGSAFAQITPPPLWSQFLNWLQPTNKNQGIRVGTTNQFSVDPGGNATTSNLVVVGTCTGCGTGGGNSATTTIFSNATSTGPNFTFATTTSGSGTLNITGSGSNINFNLNTSGLQPAGNYVTNSYASSTFVNYAYGTSTYATIANYPTYTYASSTYQAKLTLPLSVSNGGTGTNTLASLTSGSSPNLTVTGGQNALIGTSTQIALGANVVTTLATGTSGSIFNGSIGNNTLTLNLPFASGSVTGQLQNSDWTTFNNKQPAGNYVTALIGDVTASGPGSVAATLATVNSNIGSFTNANITVNGKGLITAASSGSAGSGSGVPSTTPFTNSHIPYATSTLALTDSPLLTDGTVVGIRATSSTANFNIQGSGTFNPFNVASSSGISMLKVTSAGNVQLGATSANSILLTDSSNNIISTTTPLPVSLGGTGTTSLQSFTLGNLGLGSGLAFTSGDGIQVLVGTSTTINLTGGTNGFDAQWTSGGSLAAGKLIDNGSVLGYNASSSTIGVNIQGTPGTNDIFNVASSSGASILKVAANNNITFSNEVLPTLTNQKFFTIVGSQSGGVMRVVRDIGLAPAVATYGTQDITAYTATSTVDYPNFTGPIQTFSISTGTMQNIIGAVGSQKDNNDTSGDLLLESSLNGQLAVNIDLAGSTTVPSVQLFGTPGASTVLNVASSSGLTSLSVSGIGNVNIATLTPTTLLSTDANKNLQSVTLTTTGTSGAATFIGNTLNIPQYSGGGGGAAGAGWSTTTVTTYGAGVVNNYGSFVGINSSTLGSTLGVMGASGSTTPIFIVASSTGANYLTVLANGNVGVGTSNPTVLGNGNTPVLDVHGDIQATGNIVADVFRDTQGSRLLTSGVSTYIIGQSGNWTSGQLNIAAGNIATYNAKGFGIGTSTPDNTLDVYGGVRFESASSTIVTSSIGGAIVSGGCDSATSSVDSTIASSTTSFITTPQNDPGTTVGGTWAYSFLSSVGVLTTRVCANITVTPISTKYVVKIIR